MYECKNCGERFSTPMIYKEDYGTGGPWYELSKACPRCKVSGMFEEIESESEDEE